MFRHGVRSWVQNFPNEPVNASFWDQFGGYGQLTSVGVKQMTEFGAYFKKYYEKLMPMPFDSAKVKAKSTDYNRTVASCRAFLNGVFSNNNSIHINATARQFDNVIIY